MTFEITNDGLITRFIKNNILEKKSYYQMVNDSCFKIIEFQQISFFIPVY